MPGVLKMVTTGVGATMVGATGEEAKLVGGTTAFTGAISNQHLFIGIAV